VQSLTKELGDLLVAQKVQRTFDENETFRASARELSHHIRKALVNKGLVLVQVKFCGGPIPLEVALWARI
jgi:hypothetical protein